MAAESLYASAYSGNRLLIFTAIFVPVQIFCVALRYLSRYLVDGSWGIDDILIVTSLVLQMCQAGVSIGAVKHAGVGYHTPYLEKTDPDKVVVWGKYLVAISTLYFAGVNIPKLGILALYRRLFPPKAIRLIVHILMAVLVALTISTVVTAFAACVPFSANWSPKLASKHCIDKEAFFRWGSIPNILTDIVMLVLPIRVVWNLHTTTRLKVGLTLTFVIGSFGLVTSIIRFATFFQNNSFIDGTWTAVDLIIWTQIEAGIYLISACVMTYRPLLERIGRGRWVAKITHNAQSGNSGDIPLKTSSGLSNQGFLKLENDTKSRSDILRTTSIHIGVEGHEEFGDNSGMITNGREQRQP